MQSVIANWDTIASTKVLTLLADDESAQFWTVFPKSILYQVLKDSGIEDSDEPVTVNRDRIQQEVGRVLGNRMRRRMVEENQECLRAKAFQPCLNFVINGVCHRNYCPRDHVARGSLDTEHVNLRIRIHLQQILLIHRIAVTVDSSIKDAQRWVSISVLNELNLTFLIQGYGLNVSTTPYSRLIPLLEIHRFSFQDIFQNMELL